MYLDRIAVLTSNGNLFIKEAPRGEDASGLDSAPWIQEDSNVTRFKIDGHRIAVLKRDGCLYVKEGGLSAGWTNEYCGVTAFDITAL
jgi:hypothetical protein